jgi:capsular polysaccharide biosynthesis protein
MPPPGEGTQAHLFTFSDATIATRCGAVMLAGGEVLLNTLDHRNSDDHILIEGNRITLPAGDRLPGCWLSMLLGASRNLFHFVLMNVTRLALLGEAEISGIRGIFVPNNLPPAFVVLLERALAATWGAWNRAVPPLLPFGGDFAARPERLILPWNTAATGYYLSRSLDLIRSLAPLGLPDIGRPFPRKLYIARTDSPARVLRNEGEVIAELSARGYTPVTLSGLDLDVQAALFSQAEHIVAPHGAGLTNLVFATPGARITELMPDRLMNWCYRRLCAMLDLKYDIVTGPASPEQPPGAAPWYVLPQDVLAACDGN